MNFSASLLESLSEKNLLKHPFYQAWTHGTLSRDTLRTYAGQYFHHVSAFPRYVSATHAGCEDIKIRQLLLENLIDEERGEENHPELWKRFAEAVGIDRDLIHATELLPETRDLIGTFLGFARSSFEEGLGALFAYEHQIPEIARFKLDALKKHYGVTDAKGLSFFEVHMKADVYHTRAISEVLETLSPEAKMRASRAAHVAAEKLWRFLDAMDLLEKLVA